MQWIKNLFNFKSAPVECEGESIIAIPGNVDMNSCFFTEAELHYLKRILSEDIQTLNCLRQGYLASAKFHKEIGFNDTSERYFKRHRQIKKQLQKLAGIQKKVKHSLITMG